MTTKRQHGQYFTKGNPFLFLPFKNWFMNAYKENNNNLKLLEPFAGSNNILILMNESFPDLNLNWNCFDIDPNVKNLANTPIIQQDVLLQFPQNYNMVITNPPYLAKNSATRRGLDFPYNKYDDLYKYCLEKCLEYTPYVAAIIPESFIVQNLFINRLDTVISLKSKMFDDTDCPVCLALFSPNKKEKNDFSIYSDEIFLGKYLDLKKSLSKPAVEYTMTFNHPEGEISVFTIDDTYGDSIKFSFGHDIESNKIKDTSRAFTRIKLGQKFTSEELCTIILLCNDLLKNRRSLTHDVFFTAFKGLRKDGKYRRRLSFSQVREIINEAIFLILNRG